MLISVFTKIHCVLEAGKRSKVCSYACLLAASYFRSLPSLSHSGIARDRHMYQVAFTPQT